MGVNPAHYLRRAAAYLRSGQVAFALLQYQTYLVERPVAVDVEREDDIRCSFAAGDSALTADLIEYGLLPALATT